MSQDYERGRRDGLRLALALLEAEEAKWSAKVGGSSSWRTNAMREVRRKMLEVAQKRIQTILGRMTPKDEGIGNDELIDALAKAGL